MVVVWFFSRKISIFVVISSQRGMLKVNPKATMHQTKEKFRMMAPLKKKSLQSYFIKLKKNLPRNFFEVFEATLAETRTYEPFALQRSLWLLGVVDIYNITAKILMLSIQLTTRITEFLVVDKSSVILVKWPKFR